MRHMNIDWHDLISRLDIWNSLEPDTQRAYLQLKTNEHLPRERFDVEDVKILLREGLLATSADQRRLRRPQEATPFAKPMRAMQRHRFHAVSDERALADYVRDHLTTEERQALLHSTSYYVTYSGSENFHLITQESWLRQVLDLPDAKAAMTWEQGRLPKPAFRPKNVQLEDGSPYFEDEALFDALKRLLAAAMTWSQPVPLTALHKHVPGVEPALLHRAIMPAVRYMLLFPWLDRNALPVIGIWPKIAYLLHRPSASRPKPVKPEQTFHTPVLVEDMTSLLVAAAAEPLRVLASGEGLFAKDMQRLAEALPAMPQWMYKDSDEEERKDESDSQLSAGVTARIRDALENCLLRGLLQSRQGERGRNQLHTTNDGSTWLRGSIHERIRTMVALWREQDQPKGRKKAQRNATAHYVMTEDGFVDMSDRGDLSPWTPPRFRWGGRDDVKKVDWRAAYVDLLSDADEAFVLMDDLLAFHSRVNNPLLGRRENGSYGPTPRHSLYGYGLREISELQLEALWHNLATELIAGVLMPLGAVEYGLSNDRPAVRVHSIGRYMLGLADDFEYHAPPEGAVIVQPNFEITFLGPAPHAEARIGRLAERTGSRTGTLFRITRASILAAAAAGISADDAVRDLTEASSKPVPDNVLREVRGWFNATRHVRMRQTWLIDAPDEHTATHILAASGKQARQLTPTLVEITTPRKDHATMLRKLKQAGIFVG